MKNFGLVFVALTVCCDSVTGQDAVVQANNDRESIELAAVQFVNAYNSQDASSLTALFSEDAEMVERDGTRFVGHEAIKEAFVATFQDNPGGKISVSVDSLRFVTPEVAVEEGRHRLVSRWRDGDDGKHLSGGSCPAEMERG